MYSDLFRYLVKYNELPIPGVGTLSIERKPARLDFPLKRIFAPVYLVQFKHTSYLPHKHFFNWLSDTNGITEREAVFRFNDFSFDMKRDLEAGSRILWNGIGELKKDENGEITLVPEEYQPEESLVAEKILRQSPEHMVKVGEDHRTSGEMTEFLGKEESKKVSWWVVALAVSIIALMFIGWYLSEHGIVPSSASNNKKFEAGETPTLNYRIPE